MVLCMFSLLIFYQDKFLLLLLTCCCICFLHLAVTLIEPYPNNVFAISGSAVNFTCIFVGDNGQPPLRVTFQRRKEIRYEWFDIPDTERVFQTNKTEGEAR